MKKKIKDLTLEEAMKICSKNSCRDCPLNNIPYNTACHLNYLEFREDLTKEVEIDESDTEKY